MKWMNEWMVTFDFAQCVKKEKLWKKLKKGVKNKKSFTELW